MRGRQALESLASRFPQLYVAPAEGADEAHRLASSRGIAPDDPTLDHFVTSEEDELREVETPAGPVEVLFLKVRRDFETFLQVMGHKSRPVPIDPTVGAITYRGIPDWGKVSAAHDECIAAGGDWPSEFSRLAKQPGAFRSELVVISEGPYSSVSYTQTPFSEDKWVSVSREIRLHHECAHVVCRRLMPDDILPVWDEVTADFVGLQRATGSYDSALAAVFLGVTSDGYVGGRLPEYLNDEQTASIDEVSAEVNDALARLEEHWEKAAEDDPFKYLLELKRHPLIGY